MSFLEDLLSDFKKGDIGGTKKVVDLGKPVRDFTRGDLFGSKDVLDLGFAGGLKGSAWGSDLDQYKRGASAEDLGTDLDDPNALMETLISASLPQLMAQVKEQGMTPEAIQQLTLLANVQTGRATQQERGAFMEQALTSRFLSDMQAGLLDDPEEMATAFEEWGTQLSEIQTKYPSAEEETTSAEDLTALYQEQMAAQAQREQVNFEREGILSLFQLIPSEQRLGAIAALIGTDSGKRLFFGESGTVGAGNAVGVAEILKQTGFI